MIKANDEIKNAVRNAHPDTVTSLRKILSDPRLVDTVGGTVGGTNFSRFAICNGRLFVRCVFGRGLYDTEIEVDAAVAVSMNLARIVGYSVGRNRRVIEIQAGGR